MKLFVALLVASAPLLAHCAPQTTLDDITRVASGASYGGSNDNIDDSAQQVSVQEVLATSDDGNYGGSNDNIDDHSSSSNQRDNDAGYEADPDLVDEVFLTNQDSIVDDSYKPAPSEVDTTSRKCSDYEADGYFCVPYYQCTEEFQIITDGGNGLIDVRGNFGTVIELDVTNSKCEGYLDVCCRHPDYNHAVTVKPVTPKPYVSGCGKHNRNGIGVRIQGSYEKATTQFGEWPHMCAVLRVDGDKNLYVGGASLIDANIVMTAAHKVKKYAQEGATLKVRCGEWDTQQEVEPLEHQDRYVEHISWNPTYASRNLTNNVALLHMKEPFILSAHVDTICLPTLDDARDSYFGEGCIATGWGKDKFEADGQYQVVLKQIELDVVPNRQCQSKLRTVERLGRFFRLDKTALCAGGEYQQDTCQGDGGGPLVCPKRSYGSYDEEPTYVQAGIVGWGIGCGEKGLPGVYTDVSTQLCYIDWAKRCYYGEDSVHVFDDRCRDWATNERRRLRYAVRAYQNQVAATKTTSPRYDILTSQLEAHQTALDDLITAMRFCGTKKTIKYVDDLVDDSDVGSDDGPSGYAGGDVDLSGFTRSTVKQEAALGKGNAGQGDKAYSGDDGDNSDNFSANSGAQGDAAYAGDDASNQGSADGYAR